VIEQFVMKFFFLIVALGLLFSGNAYSKTTSLICKLENHNDTFPILLEHDYQRATWNDKVIDAVFSSTRVTFSPAKMGSIDNVYLKMQYSINRINLEVVKTVTISRTLNIDKINEVISSEKGVCKIGKVIETKF